MTPKDRFLAVVVSKHGDLRHAYAHGLAQQAKADRLLTAWFAANIVAAIVTIAIYGI